MAVCTWPRMIRRISSIVGLLLLAMQAAADPVVVSLWRHQAAREETRASLAAVQRFNASQSDWAVSVEQLPQSTYSQAITAAALANRLPCILEVDQPETPNFAWAGHLRRLEPLLGTVIEPLPETAKGTYREGLYSVGQFDAAVALYARRSALAAINARIPDLDHPWTRAEFDQVLTALKARNPDAYVLDAGIADGAAWWTYAFLPWLQGFGGALIDRETLLVSEGVLNGDHALEWGIWFQRLFERGYVNPRPPDQKGFSLGRTPLSYAGNWRLNEYQQAWGDDLLILPPPDLGQGVIIGGGSWQWGITTRCEHPEGAAAFLRFLLSDDEVAAISRATGLIPVTTGGAALTLDYRVGGKKRVFYDLAGRFARSRPATPAFPVMSSIFAGAARDIRDGRPVHDVLDDAVDDIQRNIVDNRSYGFAEEGS